MRCLSYYVNYLIFYFFLHSTVSDENRNVNVNVNRNREDIAKVTEYGTLEEIGREETSTNCISGSRKNQRYSSSFFENITDQALTVEKDFHDVVGNNSKVRKSGSVHEGEDITLCWIETTTIKEDKSIQPLKRLVIREYTISFENSATIPERYLECKRYEGELAANDPEVGKTALFEVVDEDTMVSRVVNFTSVSRSDNITSWVFRKVKCGVGPVVSKNIVELNDGSKNPKKRVEIKVSPKMHQLTATTTDEEEPCTESSEEKSTESTERTVGPSCENGDCETTITSPSTSTEIGTAAVTKSEEEYSSPAVTLSDEELSKISTTVPKISTTIQKSQEKADCEENSSDPACFVQKYVTPSSEELSDLSAEGSTTEELTKTSSIPISDKEITTKEPLSSEEITQPTFTSREERQITSKETTPFTVVTDISKESSEASQAIIDEGGTSLETEVTHGATEEYPKSEEGSGDHSEPSSEEIIGHIPASSTIATVDVTTAVPIKITESAKESEKPGLDSIENGGAIESSLTSEEVTSEKSKESETFATEGTTVGSTKTSGEEEFIPMTTRALPTEISSSTLPPVSNEIDYSCENSEECMYITSSEACDEFGECGKITSRCDSEECSEEDITEQSKFDTSFPIVTEIPSVDLELSKESVETQHTTVANVATTMLTQESEDNSTAINTIPTMDTRRSTTTSKPQHKLSLQVKVVLEHINEKKEKRNLIEVEKHLSLDESPEHHDNPNLVEQLKSLNNSVNMETINALLNCTKLGNWIRDSNYDSKESNDAIDSNNDLEFRNSYVEDSSAEQFDFGHDESAKNDYSEYKEVLSRRRRSLDNEMKRNRFVRDLPASTDSAVDSFNISTTQQAENSTENSTFSTTTNHPEEETTENERNVTEEADESTVPSTTVNVVDLLLNVTESHDVTESITEGEQLNATTNKPEEATSNVAITENEKNTTSDRNESVSTNKNLRGKTKLEVVRDIQEDVVVGLKHMVSQLTQSNLTAINKEAVKKNLLDILADPKDTRIRRRRRRAAMEEVGHWSNERIKEAPMGGNFRSLTEFTLYKVFS